MYRHVSFSHIDNVTEFLNLEKLPIENIVSITCERGGYTLVYKEDYGKVTREKSRAVEESIKEYFTHIRGGK